MQSYFHGRATIIKARQKSKYRLLSGLFRMWSTMKIPLSKDNLMFGDVNSEKDRTVTLVVSDS